MADFPNPIQIQKFLGGMDYPVTKETILSTAKDKGADEPVLTALGNIPDGEYDAPTAISKAVSESNS